MTAGEIHSLRGVFNTFVDSLCQTSQSQVAIVEEAGELLEGQVMASIDSPRLQHLILIGDHQQLRPKVHSHLPAYAAGQ